jgi:hypothetical protein
LVSSNSSASKNITNTTAGQTSNNTKNAKALVETKNMISSKSEGGMSDADVKCYQDRYADVKGDPREHYANVGEKEGRQ